MYLQAFVSGHAFERAQPGLLAWAFACLWGKGRKRPDQRER
jgi:hypothetical protein